MCDKYVVNGNKFYKYECRITAQNQYIGIVVIDIGHSLMDFPGYKNKTEFKNNKSNRNYFETYVYREGKQASVYYHRSSILSKTNIEKMKYNIFLERRNAPRGMHVYF